MTVGEVKGMIVDKEGLQAEDLLRLSFAGNRLDDDRMLDYYSIEMGSILYVTEVLSGGGPKPFADVSNSNSLEEMAFIRSNPRYAEQLYCHSNSTTTTPSPS